MKLSGKLSVISIQTIRMCGILSAALLCVLIFQTQSMYADTVPRLSDKRFSEEVIQLTGEYEKPITPKMAERNPYATSRLIVSSSDRFLDPDDYGAIEAIQNRDGVYILQFETSAKARRAMKTLSELDSTRYVEPDYVVFGDSDPSEELILSESSASGSSSGSSVQWNVSQMGFDRYAEYIKAKGLISGGTTVAVLDTGISFSHPMLQGRLLTDEGMAQSFVDGCEVDESKQPSSDRVWHGTHVAGIIAQCTENLSVDILPVRVLGANKSGSLANVCAGIDHALEKNADVINMSISALINKSSYLESHILEAVNAGAVIVVSSGNDGVDMSTNTVVPAYIPQCIVVGAATKDYTRASFSNYGGTLDVVAPGYSIKSAYISSAASNYNTVEYANGTSMAAPHVAAQAAVLKMVYPSRTPAEIEKLIQNSAVDLKPDGWDNNFGFGFASLEDFMQCSVTFNPGDHGAFAPVTHSVTYKDALPSAPGTAGAEGYEFTGWLPELSETVTGDVEYVAQWKKTAGSSGDGSGQSGSGGNQQSGSGQSESGGNLSGSGDSTQQSSGSTQQGSGTQSGSGTAQSGSAASGSTQSGSAQSGSAASGSAKPKTDEAQASSDPDVNSGTQHQSDDSQTTYALSNPYPNADYLVPLKKKQKTTALKVLGLGTGDSVVSWVSSDTKKASVSGNPDGTCLVRAGKKAGKAVISAVTASGNEVTFRIKVQKNKVSTKKILVETKCLVLSAGDIVSLSPTLYPVTSVDSIKYESGKKNVASVNKKGLVKAKSAGTAVITIRSGKKKIKVKVIVQ